MIRYQSIEKNKDLKRLFPLIRYMAALPKSNCYYISLSSVELLDLWNEINSNGKLSSGNKISFNYAEKLASRAFFKLHKTVISFRTYINHNFNISHVYAYLLTVNPKDLHYQDTKKVNSKIIAKLRSNGKTALIQKEVENSYCNTYNNIHFHYLIIATSRLNQRKIKRMASKVGRDVTNSKTGVNVSIAKNGNDLKQLESYVTKQYGLPLPLKNNQFERFDKMPFKKKIGILADDINKGKGIIRHYIYVNPKNKFAKAWKHWLDQRKKNDKNNVLVNPKQNHNDKDFYINEHSTVFPDKDYFKLNPHARVRNSKHHGTFNEANKLYKYGNRYANPKPLNIKQLSLFNRSLVTV